MKSVLLIRNSENYRRVLLKDFIESKDNIINFYCILDNFFVIFVGEDDKITIIEGKEITTLNVSDIEITRIDDEDLHDMCIIHKATGVHISN